MAGVGHRVHETCGLHERAARADFLGFALAGADRSTNLADALSRSRRDIIVVERGDRPRVR